MTPDELRAARAALGLTQQALADALGVNQVTVARWETGRLPIDRRTQMAVEHLGCKQNKLKGNHNEQETSPS